MKTSFLITSALVLGTCCVKFSQAANTPSATEIMQSKTVELVASELAVTDLKTLLGYTNKDLTDVNITKFEVLILKGGNTISKTVEGSAIPDDIKFILRQMKTGEKVMIQKIKARGTRGEVRVLPVSITIK